MPDYLVRFRRTEEASMTMSLDPVDDEDKRDVINAANAAAMVGRPMIGVAVSDWEAVSFEKVRPDGLPLPVPERARGMRPFDLVQQLGALSAEHRRQRGLTVREACAEIGLASHSMLYGLESGKDCRISTIVKVLAWIERG